MSRVDFHNLAARRKPGVPADFVWCMIRCVGDSDLLTGCSLPTAAFACGPRKGRPKWPPKSQMTEVVVSQAELAAARARWELETGLCSECNGTGETMASAEAMPEGGVKITYRICARCKGSKLTPGAA